MGIFSLNFFLPSAPLVQAVTPASLPTTGDSLITIFGTNFGFFFGIQASQIRVNLIGPNSAVQPIIPCPVQGPVQNTVGFNYILCTVPPGVGDPFPGKVVRVEIQTPGGPFRSSETCTGAPGSPTCPTFAFDRESFVPLSSLYLQTFSFPAPQVTGVIPPTSPTTGLVTITIFGKNFGPR